MIGVHKAEHNNALGDGQVTYWRGEERGREGTWRASTLTPGRRTQRSEVQILALGTYMFYFLKQVS